MTESGQLAAAAYAPVVRHTGVTKHTDTIILGVFLALLVVGLWCVWQVRSGFPPEAPPEFHEIHRHLLIFAWALLCFATLGLWMAFAIVRGRPWGHRALAWLVTFAAASTGIVRTTMAPRVVVDPDWPLVLGLVVTAVWCWRRAISAQTDA